MALILPGRLKDFYQGIVILYKARSKLDLPQRRMPVITFTCPSQAYIRADAIRTVCGEATFPENHKRPQESSSQGLLWFKCAVVFPAGAF